jgi:hypothetical protein
MAYGYGAYSEMLKVIDTATPQPTGARFADLFGQGVPQSEVMSMPKVPTLPGAGESSHGDLIAELDSFIASMG